MTNEAADGRVETAVQGSVATITLHNPAKRNAMTTRMWDSLPPLLAELEQDASVLAVVLTGAGEHFCAGADITSLVGTLGIESPVTPDDSGMALSPPERAEEALAAFAKPTVAAIRGACVGGGVELALACDLRIASNTARFGVTPAKIGVFYPPRTTARLVAAVGPAYAKQLLFTGDLMLADEARRIGLVNELAESDALDNVVASLLETITARSQLSIRAAKAIVDAATAYGVDGPLGAVATATHWQDVMVRSGDPQEGIAAFAERRAPEFRWR
ncbi:enoyl-CoA hydratase/isomerase family protein [Flexivirga sp. ID2601S]|uniref:Enoyl-CoA hydratase/isomerase family protein n=1 Tax=Flexivirga aerilata TaxID=1656889 RepID=A0A849AG23_9MICO|nr:enoyl-CoA hydratase/isomerase family protein [Flexivirga aerilata]NNG38526.1 enoyl-CoA hydratase/isomerase family protein [Flexivirga aerilata]